MREPRQYLETDMLKTEIFAMNSKYSKIVSSKVVKVLLQSTFSVRLQRLSMPEICFVGIEGHRKVSREKAKIQILTSPVMQFSNTFILIIIIHNIKIFQSVKYSMTRKIISTFSSCVRLFFCFDFIRVVSEDTTRLLLTRKMHGTWHGTLTAFFM